MLPANCSEKMSPYEGEGDIEQEGTTKVGDGGSGEAVIRRFLQAGGRSQGWHSSICAQKAPPRADGAERAPVGYTGCSPEKGAHILP